MLLVDARRLTGPNLLSRSPLVVVEISLDIPDVFEHCREVYLSELGRMRLALGFSADVSTTERPHRGGAVIGYEAPIDVMLACAEMSEWAVLSACEVLRGRAGLALEPKQVEIQAILDRDRSPRMLALEAEARHRGVPFLWDDAEVSVGSGPTSKTWSRFTLPNVSDVAWDELRSIPVALVTGTNGKTTSTRLLARLVGESGRVVGSSSSDAVVVGSTVLEEGDWTGPAAARTILRRNDVDVAVLETARGGLLRRGLAMESCDVALITNVSEDHTGGYGIDDIGAMTRVKAVVAYAVRAGGVVVLNAHDPKLVALGASLPIEVVYFADDARNDAAARAVLDAHRARGGKAVAADKGAIVRFAGAETAIVPVAIPEVPITFGGAARYNVENVLGAVACAHALGVDDAAIAAGLAGFQTRDNPRRGEVVERRGVRVFLDFGHNPEGVRAVLALVQTLRRSGRLFIVAGSAGDRTNHELREMALAICEAKPYRIVLRELTAYLRGRIPGEVPGILTHMLEQHGHPAEAIHTVSSEVDALTRVFAEAASGDFVLVLVHIEQRAVHAYLDTLT